MKKLLLILSLITFAACTEEKIIQPEEEPLKRLVIITDFEKGSAFAIILLGALERSFPEVETEFITAPPFDVYEASYLLEKAAEEYPKGTYFAAIVGTGVDNKVIIFEKDSSRFLCPDNGIASRVTREDTARFYFVENEAYLGGTWDDLSYTEFYKNAVLALLSVYDINSFGAENTDPLKLNIVDAKVENGEITGQVLFRDNFGNCNTNINDNLMNDIFNEGDLVRIKYGKETFFIKYGTYYSSVKTGENVCFVNSGNMLEIAVNYGSFSERYNITAGGVFTMTKAEVKLAVLMYNESSVAAEIKEGMLNEMENRGFIEGKNLSVTIKNAEGENSALNTFAKELLSENPDIFVSISTPASQAGASAIPENIPLIFTYVTDPESAGLMSMRKNISGLSDRTNFTEYLDFVNTLLPEIQTAGNMYSSAEANSVFAKAQFEKYESFYPFDIIFEDAPSKNHFYNAYSSLKINEMDALLIAANNAASDGMKDLVMMCNADDIPLIGDSYEHARDGALAAISVDYEKLSESTGEMVSGVILGKPLSDEPIRYFSTDLTAVNKKTAKNIGFTFPEEILEKAVYIFE